MWRSKEELPIESKLVIVCQPDSLDYSIGNIYKGKFLDLYGEDLLYDWNDICNKWCYLDELYNNYRLLEAELQRYKIAYTELLNKRKTNKLLLKHVNLLYPLKCPKCGGPMSAFGYCYFCNK